MLLQLLLTFLFIIICVVKRWRNRRILRLSRAIRNKYPSLPLIGHGYMFIGTNEDRMTAFKAFGLEATNNNGVTSLWLGDHYYTVVADPVVADKVMKTCLEKGEFMSLFQHLIGNGSLIAPVNIWRPRRKLVAPTFALKNLQDFVKIFSHQSGVLAEQLASVADNEAVSIWKYFTTYAMKSSYETTLGLKLNAQEQPDALFLAAFDEYCRLTAARVCQPWLRVQLLYRLLPDFARLDRHKKYICEYVDKVIRLKKKEGRQEVTENSNDDKSFLGSMIHPSGGGHGFTDHELREESLVMLLAGTDTSAVGASYTATVLSRYSDVQEKVYAELCEVFGTSHIAVVPSDLPKLRYLEAVIKECMRLYPPVAIIARALDKDVILPSGLTLVKDSGVIINIWALHRNPRCWGPDAAEFRPERFLENSLEHPATFIPFSYGPRNCVGLQYGMMSMKTALATVLRRFRLSAAEPGAELPLRVKYDIMMRDVDNYMVRLQPRPEWNN